MNAMEPTLRLRFRVTTFQVMESPRTIFTTFINVEMFPSFDKSSNEFNEVSPNFCKYYRALPKDGGCQFTKEVNLFCLKDSG